jgi:uncharacterized protein (DUF1778 family)
VVSSIRIDPSTKSRIQRAARKVGMSCNEFIAKSAADRAEDVLASEDVTPANLQRVMEAAARLDIPSHPLTSASTIRDPFPGLIDREKRLRE